MTVLTASHRYKGLYVVDEREVEVDDKDMGMGVGAGIAD